MINQVTLVGYVGKDAKVETFDTGRKVAIFSLATSRTYTDKNNHEHTITQWHNIAAWGHLAELKVHKGMMYMVHGEVTYRKYTDKNDIERIHTDIVATRMYEITRQSKNDIPMPTEADMPVRTGAAAMMNKDVAVMDDLPF
jgi:single-strand DNA-binding protein